MEEERFNCKKCNKEIDGHNKHCHDGMCDDCFFNTYFLVEEEILKPKDL